MTRISPRHPRYASLKVRAELARHLREGLVVPEGLIAHGRGEAFDYFLGVRTSPSAARAERVAADWIRTARHPVLSVNGNVAALAAPEVAALQEVFPALRVEVNLFHRTAGRAARVARVLRTAGVRDVLGIRPTARLAGLDSDRARIDARGIARADLCLIPLEDGDRAEALKARGVRTIAIDLNPLSRTAIAADLPIIDELGRALRAIAGYGRAGPPRRSGAVPRGPALRAAAVRTMSARLRASSARRPR